MIRVPQPGDKARALQLATYATVKSDAAASRRAVAVRFAAGHGASSSEISEATGLPAATVQRILENC